MRKIRRTQLAVIATAVLLCACSSQDDASEANFAKAISAKLESNPDLCYGHYDWPEKVATADMNFTGADLRAMEAAGLVASRPALAPPTAPWLNGTGRMVPAREYFPTENGKRYFHNGQLCYGRLALDRIAGWSPVEKVAGMDAAVTTVSFAYRIDGFPDWAKRSDVQAGIPGIRSAAQGIAQHRTIRLAMTLADSHWSVDWPGAVTP